MTEDQLQQVERWLDTADAKVTAAVLVAAIVRMGELGLECSEAFTELKPDFRHPTYVDFEDGAAQLVDALDRARGQ